MSYTHLTIEDRSKIEVLYYEGYTASQIAEAIGRHRSTIYRELKRVKSASYDAQLAQDNATKHKSLKGRRPKHTPELIQDIQTKLELTWSPEQIVGRCYQNRLSFKTIYNWIYQGVIEVSLSCLRQKGNRRKPQETRGRFNIGTSIKERPNTVKKRQEFGHWELDTVVSSRGKSKGCLATFAERKSRFYVALKMPNRSKESMLSTVNQLIQSFPKAALKSFTSDRGKEFACYSDIEQQDIDFYFADAYCAWQRGTNENSNGLLREFFPKGTDLTKITEHELFNALWLINNRPRKCLGFKTPFEVLMHELGQLA
ncbi:IS30 family transposase [Aerococcaceae bacterium WGS1372]